MDLFLSIYEKLNITSTISIVIISIAIMLFSGFALTRITKLLKLPNVTAYIVAGILIGPYCLNLIPEKIVEGTSFLADISLAFIAFGTGEFFRLEVLKKNGLKVTIITVFEALMATLLVFIVSYFVLKLNLAFSAVLGALAAATAPASTMMTIRQTNAKGDFVDTLLQVVALDDVVGLVAYSVAISIAVASISGQFSVSNILKPILLNGAVLILGCAFGFLLKLLMPKKRSTDNRLIISIAVLFLFCGICSLFDVSPLLGCMSMGTIYINITNDDKLFKQLNYFNPPILLLFFVRSGVSFDLKALTSTSLIGAVPIIVIGVVYFVVRIVGKYAGSFLGCLITKKEKTTRNYLGLALIPQAGVAIGLAALGARTIGGEIGNALETIILASSVLYELIGPACAKLSLYLSKSYNQDIIEKQTESVEMHSKINDLVAKINDIQKKLPEHNEYHMSEEEKAFLEAAEEQYGSINYQQKFINKR
ncbi:MAG: cation:proton antiporter [Candidatus Caccosoma sp.]|nr:cation:proton antiporter [Candidatus Caccosoma sp.]